MSSEKTELLTFAEAGRRLGRGGKAVSDAVYTGRLDPSGWPVIGGRRFVPASALAQIAAVFNADRRRKQTA